MKALNTNELKALVGGNSLYQAGSNGPTIHQGQGEGRLFLSGPSPAVR